MSEEDSNAKSGRRKAPPTEAELTAARLQMIREFVAQPRTPAVRKTANAPSIPSAPLTPAPAPTLQQDEQNVLAEPLLQAPAPDIAAIVAPLPPPSAETIDAAASDADAPESDEPELETAAIATRAPTPLAMAATTIEDRADSPTLADTPEDSAPSPISDDALQAATATTPEATVENETEDPTIESSAAKMPDPVALGHAFINLMEKSQPLMRNFMERVKLPPMEAIPLANMPIGMNAPWLQLTQQAFSNPQKLVDAQLGLWQDYMRLWQNTTKRFLGQPYETVIEAPPNDKRFKDEAWSQNTLFDFIKQSYLLTAQWLRKEANAVEGIDDSGQRKVDFYIRQFIDALAPSNFIFTNPEVLRRTAETGGDNLVKGLQNLLQDLERGQGQLKISMADTNAFTLGENIATTAGKVVFQNDMMQLIQYEPLTDMVHTTPLLIIPPWINKYYILDMREKNSFVRHCLAQGHTVFMISWVNPDERHAQKDFSAYMLEGPFAALQEIKRRTGAAAANVLGYCIGGTLLACLLAYLQERQEQAAKIPLIASATYLVTLIDFKEPGELGVFIDEEQVSALETQMAEKGYLDAAAMAQTFSMLRANDLIWSFVVNNYLLGREPFPFDLLYWNSDATRMPAAMHSQYLRQMYLENRLIEPNGLRLDDTPIDVRKITTPSFLLSTREDHIAPWQSTYAATQLYSGTTKFVLAGSGHVAGVVNPPAAEKYGYWTNDSLPATPQDWLKDAQQHNGSWWTAWLQWLTPYQGRDIPAREPDAPILEDAPGSYVRERA